MFRAFSPVAMVPLALTFAILGRPIDSAAQAARPKAPTTPRKAAPAVPAKPAGPTTPAPAAAAAPPAPAKATAVYIRTRYTANAQVSENSAWFGPARQRFEFPRLAMLSQCDLGRTVQLSEATRHYLVVSTASAATSAATAVGTSGQATPAPAPATAPKKGGVVTVTVTTTDTGERKTLLDREARHLTVVTERRPDANACDKQVERISIDGWYVDAPQMAAACQPSATSTATPAATPESSCSDRIETKTIGTAATGFAVATTVTTAHGALDDKPDAFETSVTTMEVTALETKTVEPTFFDIPAGYTEVTSMAALLSASDALPATAVSDALSDALLGSVADGTRSVAPKAAGITRVGLAPLANTSGRELSTSSLNYSLAASLGKAPYESVPLVGTTPAELESDARAKGCDYILTSTLTELKASKPGKAGGLLKKVTGDVTPGGENHDARVEYKLFAIAGNAGSASSASSAGSDKPVITGAAKASSGGGFGVGSALKVASFAGQIYLGAMTGGMGGFGRMGAFGQLGLGQGLGTMAQMSMTNAMMGPGMGAAMSAMSGVPSSTGAAGMPGMDQSGAAAERTASDAFRKAGGDILEGLKKKAK